VADVVLRPATASDARTLAVHLRDIDIVECAAVGLTPYGALRQGLEASVHARTAVLDGEPIAMFGIAPLGGLLSTTGAIWLLGTEAMRAQRVALMRLPLGYIDGAFEAGFQHLLNYVHADNVVAVRWLRRLGFTIHPAGPFGVRGEMFHRFEMHADGHQHLHARAGRGPAGPGPGTP